jgi:hypothetical protein
MVGLRAKVLGRLGRTENSPSKSVCSILPLARRWRAGEFFSGSTPARGSLLKPAAGQQVQPPNDRQGAYHRQRCEYYWIGKPYWGLGYATEAAEEVVRYGFEDLALHRIQAKHFGSNPASGKVMRKVGMSQEGVRPEHYKKWETYEDRVDYGLLACDCRKNKRR